MQIYLIETQYHLTISMLTCNVNAKNILLVDSHRISLCNFVKENELFLSEFFLIIIYLHEFYQPTSHELKTKKSSALRYMITLKNEAQNIRNFVDKISNEKKKFNIFSINILELTFISIFHDDVNFELNKFEDGWISYVNKKVTNYKTIGVLFLIEILNKKVRLKNLLNFKNFFFWNPDLVLNQAIYFKLKTLYPTNISKIIDYYSIKFEKLKRENYIFFLTNNNSEEISFYENHLKDKGFYIKSHPGSTLINNLIDNIPWEIYSLIIKGKKILISHGSTALITPLIINQDINTTSIFLDKLLVLDISPELTNYIQKMTTNFPLNVFSPSTVEDFDSLLNNLI